MVENVIREHHTELYTLISKTATNIDWDSVNSQLDILNYLDFTDTKPTVLVSTLWSLMDNWAESELSLSKRFNLLKQMKVRLSLSTFLSKTSEKSELKEICTICQRASSFPKFNQACRTLLATSSPDIFPASALKVYEIYSEIRKQASGIFMCFEKHLKQEKSPNLSEMIDRNFYEHAFQDFKVQWQAECETKRILGDFDKYTKVKETRDDTVSIASSGFASRIQNNYMGELNAEGEREGYGKIEYSSGDFYEGFWKNGKRSGNGLYRFRGGGTYLGNFVDNFPLGRGQRVYSSGNFYEGEFYNGKKHGRGVMKFRNGDVFEGNWDNDDMHGDGSYFWSSGDFFVGKFERDVRNGPGVLHLVNGSVIEGVWKNNNLEF